LIEVEVTEATGAAHYERIDARITDRAATNGRDVTFPVLAGSMPATSGVSAGSTPVLVISAATECDRRWNDF
jgi:hypothetical protein